MSEEKKAIKVFDDVNKETPESDIPEGALVVNAENAMEIIKTGKGVLELSKPTDIGGKKVSSIYFDLSSVSAMKYRGIIKKVERQNRMQIPDPSKDIDVQMEIFAEASDIPVAELKTAITMKDLSQIETVVYYFLAA
jgi:hypothetical protein